MTARLAALLVLLWSQQASALEAEAVAVDGVLRAGEWARVWVGVVDNAGKPLRIRPAVRCERTALQPIVEETPEGVSSWWVLPDTGARHVACVVTWAGESVPVTMDLAESAVSAIRTPRRVVGEVGGVVQLRVEGAELVPEALQVELGEGRVQSVEADDRGLVVRILPDDSPMARVMLVGLRDRRTEAPPVWVLVRLRTTHILPVESEVGATVEVRVGDRRYAPRVIDESGSVDIEVVQYPEDDSAIIRVTDSAGNLTEGSMWFSSRKAPQLVAFVGSPRYPNEPPPPVWVAVIGGDGRWWPGGNLRCSTPRIGDIQTSARGQGVWLLEMPRVDPQDAWELRVRCGLEDVASTSFSVGLADAVPVQLRVRVYPEVLSTDFPLADVAVSLVNAVGERVPISGQVFLEADYGTVTVSDDGGPVLRAEYEGEQATDIGEDRIVATWQPAPGEGVVDYLKAVVLDARGARAMLAVRALDDLRRPLAGVAIQADGDSGLTDERGWVRLSVPQPEGRGPNVYTAWTAHRVAHTIAVRGTTFGGGPDRPDLEARSFLHVDPGRVADVDIVLQPSELEPGPRARSTVEVRFLDRNGVAVEEPEPSVETSEGTLLPLSTAADGTLRWRLVAPPGFKERDIEVTARSETLDVSSASRLRLRAIPPRWILGFSAGLQSNFRRISTPRIAVDLEYRIVVGDREEVRRPSGPSRFMLRAGLGWYGFERGPKGATDGATIRMDLLPFSVAFQLRQEFPTQAFWFAVGGEVVPYRGVALFEGQIIRQDWRVLSPAIVGIAGYGLRVPGGEVALELRASTLTSAGSEISLQGPLGGLSALLSYRLLF